jgi:hypothetical protein
MNELGQVNDVFELGCSQMFLRSLLRGSKQPAHEISELCRGQPDRLKGRESVALTITRSSKRNRLQLPSKMGWLNSKFGESNALAKPKQLNDRFLRSRFQVRGVARGVRPPRTAWIIRAEEKET